ncbi:MAG: type II toxin-antitoxin system RelE/ParE family toxin [Proteobacteria bacterium]|nr:type II toxin-antitoxin system RelE/ParE family toxin [Pseudomonadota bacterium]
MASKSGWVVSFFSDAVHKEMRKLPDSVREDFDAVRKVIEDDGLGEVPSHYIKKLKGPGKLWELRLTGRDGIARAIYVKRVGVRIIILVVFEKKSQGIPKHILRLARKRGREV